MESHIREEIIAEDEKVPQIEEKWSNSNIYSVKWKWP